MHAVDWVPHWGETGRLLCNWADVQQVMGPGHCSVTAPGAEVVLQAVQTLCIPASCDTAPPGYEARLSGFAWTVAVWTPGLTCILMCKISTDRRGHIGEQTTVLMWLLCRLPMDDAVKGQQGPELTTTTHLQHACVLFALYD